MADTNTGTDANSKKSRKGLIIVLALIVVVGAAAGSALITTQLLQGKKVDILSRFRKPPEEKLGPTVALDEFLVNFGGEQRVGFARFRIVMEVENAKAVKAIEEWSPALRNAIITDVRDRTMEDFASGERLASLAAELASKLNAVMEKDIVRNLYFTDFIIQ